MPGNVYSQAITATNMSVIRNRIHAPKQSSPCSAERRCLGQLLNTLQPAVRPLRVPDMVQHFPGEWEYWDADIFVSFFLFCYQYSSYVVPLQVLIRLKLWSSGVKRNNTYVTALSLRWQDQGLRLWDAMLLPLSHCHVPLRTILSRYVQ